MTDVTGPEHDRDPELAAALAVPPLDASTRAALVRDAMEAGGGTAVASDGPGEEAPADDGDDTHPDDVQGDGAADQRPSRVARVLGLAAALLVGAVVGTVIVTQPGDEGVQTAARAPSTTTAQEGAKAAAPDASTGASDAAEAPAAASAPPVELGDLGPVSGAAGLRDAVHRRLEAGTGPTPASSPCLQVDREAAAGIYGLVTISAIGSANLDGRTVVVLVGPTRAGESVAVVLDPGRGCEFVQNVPI